MQCIIVYMYVLYTHTTHTPCQVLAMMHTSLVYTSMHNSRNNYTNKHINTKEVTYIVIHVPMVLVNLSLLVKFIFTEIC